MANYCIAKLPEKHFAEFMLSSYFSRVPLSCSVEIGFLSKSPYNTLKIDKHKNELKSNVACG